MTYRGRFAPSPTGVLHFGSLVAAVGSWLRARAQNGHVARSNGRPRSAARGSRRSAACILDTLAAFGMESDEPVVYQSSRQPAYEAAFAALQSRSLVSPAGAAAATWMVTRRLHRGRLHCRAGSQARHQHGGCERPTVRSDSSDAVFGAQHQNVGARPSAISSSGASKAGIAYQLAVVVDDAAQGITEIVRGADLLESTPRQICLQRLLGLPTPDYPHLPVVVETMDESFRSRTGRRPVDAARPRAGVARRARIPRPAACCGDRPAGLLQFGCSSIRTLRTSLQHAGALSQRRRPRAVGIVCSAVCSAYRGERARSPPENLRWRSHDITCSVGNWRHRRHRHGDLSSGWPRIGHRVATNYRDKGKADAWAGAQLKAQGVRSRLSFAGDVGDPASAEAIVRTVEQQLGPVDILINNAGITRDTTFHKMTRDAVAGSDQHESQFLLQRRRARSSTACAIASGVASSRSARSTARKASTD